MVVEAEFAHPTMTLLVNAALVVLALMVLRLGIWATVLTVALVVLLLCHPMLHTFLELAVPNTSCRTRAPHGTRRTRRRSAGA